MDLLNTYLSTLTITNIKSDALLNRINDILSNLQQAGLFRAIVVESKGNKVLLDTSFGQITGSAPDKLAKGDEILARLLPGKPDPTIKIEQIQTGRPALPLKIINQLIKLLSIATKPVITNATLTNAKTVSSPQHTAPALLQAIKVIGHTAEKTLLQLDHKSYTIPRQPLLQAGETLLLKPRLNGKTELLRVQPETILKNALSNLLPRIANTENRSELSHLHKLLTNFLKLKPADTVNVKPTSKNDHTDLQSIINRVEKKLESKFPDINQPISKAEAKVKPELALPATPVKPDKKVTPPIATPGSQKEVPVKLLKQLVTTLAQPVARVDSFKAESLQQILGMLTLLKPTASANVTKALFSIPNNLSQLHQSLKISPENFKTLVQQIIESNAGKSKSTVSDNAMPEISNTLKFELLQQLEQSISQLLTQKTTIRLNQELNQPIQINLSIPLQVDDKTTSLKLNIKQRQNPDNQDEKHWEIHLTFEFGLLGLITTNILLQDTKLSAHFWAVKNSTKDLIETHMSQFKNQLKKSGFELGLFDCFIGKPISKDETIDPIAENLVDIKV